MSGGIIAIAGLLLVNAVVYILLDWDMSASCPGNAAFCEGQIWQVIETYLPKAMFLGLVVTFIAQTSPFVLMRA